jgi:hypothetical protein
MVKEVGSPTNTHVRDSDRRGETASMHSSVLSRADRLGGHIAPHVGKNAATNPKLTRQDDGDHVFRHSGSFQNFPNDGDNQFKGGR